MARCELPLCNARSRVAAIASIYSAAVPEEDIFEDLEVDDVNEVLA